MKLQNKFLLVATFMGLISVANSSLYSQEFSNETGFALGVSSYMGDANKSRFFYNPGLAGGMVFRYNFSLSLGLESKSACRTSTRRHTIRTMLFQLEQIILNDHLPSGNTY